MKKILWLSNFRFCSTANSGSGSWIEAMGKGLVRRRKYQIYNITLGDVNHVVQSVECGITQWVLPIRFVMKKNLVSLPPMKIVKEIIKISDAVAPDLIHVWGTERFWGVLTARKILKCKSLLEMQGIPSAMVPYMTGCLTVNELLKCHGIKEFLRPHLSPPAVQRQFEKAFRSEREMYEKHLYIDYESEWVKSYVEPYALNAKLFKVRMALREEFCTCGIWRYQEGCHTIFTTCGWAANKGLHTLVRACGLLKRRYPDVKLVVAGTLQDGIRRNGYAKWLLNEIKKLAIDVEVIGAVDTNRIIDEMKKTAVFVNPSFVESYSMSLAEAMAVGCPCVATYAGAMPEVGGDTCLYFPVADAGMCAHQIQTLFENQTLASRLGAAASERSRKMHAVDLAVQRQCEIYESILI